MSEGHDGAELIERNGLTFHQNDTVVLDGHRFINCKFSHCKIIFAGGNYAFEGNISFQGVQWLFYGDAWRTVDLLKKLAATDPAILTHIRLAPYNPAS